MAEGQRNKINLKNNFAFVNKLCLHLVPRNQTRSTKHLTSLFSLYIQFRSDIIKLQNQLWKMFLLINQWVSTFFAVMGRCCCNCLGQLIDRTFAYYVFLQLLQKRSRWKMSSLKPWRNDYGSHKCCWLSDAHRSMRGCRNSRRRCAHRLLSVFKRAVLIFVVAVQREKANQRGFQSPTSSSASPPYTPTSHTNPPWMLYEPTLSGQGQLPYINRHINELIHK